MVEGSKLGLSRLLTTSTCGILLLACLLAWLSTLLRLFKLPQPKEKIKKSAPEEEEEEEEGKREPQTTRVFLLPVIPTVVCRVFLANE